MRHIRDIIILLLLLTDIAFPQNNLLNKLDEYLMNKHIYDISIIDTENLLLVSDINFIKMTPDKIFRYELNDDSKGPAEKYLKTGYDFTTNLYKDIMYWTKIFNINDKIFLMKYEIDTTNINVLYISNDTVKNIMIKKQGEYFNFKNLFSDSTGNIFANVTFYDTRTSSKDIYDVVYKFSNGRWDELIKIKSDSRFNSIILYNSEFYLVNTEEIYSQAGRTFLWKIKNNSLSFINTINASESTLGFNTYFDGENIYLSKEYNKIIKYNIPDKSTEVFNIERANFSNNNFLIDKEILYTVKDDTLIKGDLKENYQSASPKYYKLSDEIEYAYKILINSDRIFILGGFYDFYEYQKNLFHFDLNALNEIKTDSIK
jgi:hypothetical protein